MRAAFKVLLDACVLAPGILGDVLLSIAESRRCFSPHWSEAILEEVKRTQSKDLRWPDHLVDLWQENVRRSFPEALVTDYEQLIPVCSNSEKDRHVLAAAVRAQAQLIVTSNLKHFLSRDLAVWSIEAIDPDSFLIDQYLIATEILVERLGSIAERQRRPLKDLLRSLSRSAPNFVDMIAVDLDLVVE